MAFTLDTKIGTILDDPRAREVVVLYIPDAYTNPMISMARGMTINRILSMPQAKQLGITREKAETLLAEVNKLVG
jgi:hypothetical protein